MPEQGEPSTRELARRLLRAEDEALDDPGAVAEACASVLERLFQRLRPMVGTGGYETLIARATMLATREYPAFRELRVPRCGAPSAEDLRPCLDRSRGPAADEAAARLVAEFLHFLARLIGPALSWVVLREVWPDVLPALGPAALGPSDHSTHEG